MNNSDFDFEELPSFLFSGCSIMHEEMLPAENEAEFSALISPSFAGGGISFEDLAIFNDYAGIQSVSTYFAVGSIPLFPGAGELKQVIADVLSEYDDMESDLV